MSKKFFETIKTRVKAISTICLGVFIALTIAGFAESPAKTDEIGRPASDYKSSVPLAWFKLQLKLVKESSGFSPPVASRAFGYSGIAVYEAVVPGIPTHQSLAGQLNGLTTLPQCNSNKEYHWPTVANAALASVTKRLFANVTGENMVAIEALEKQFADQFKSALSQEMFDRSLAQGGVLADAIYTWSLTDGGHEAYLKNFPDTYTPPVGSGLWGVPAPPAFTRALQPYWGNNRPFVLASRSECQPGPHTSYSEQSGSAFNVEAMEVFNTVKNITPEQRTIAEFWADDPSITSTPPGHSISILNQIIEQKDLTLDIAAEAYARVGMAVADAFISCFYTKYQYNLLRPITYINLLIAPNWQPLLITPPFPEYTSGHSVQSGATAQVMTDMFGKVAFTDHTHDSLGLAPRSFESFFEAADEAAISRLYGGVHFRAAIEKGVTQGKCIGQKVSALRFRK